MQFLGYTKVYIYLIGIYADIYIYIYIEEGLYQACYLETTSLVLYTRLINSSYNSEFTWKMRRYNGKFPLYSEAKIKIVSLRNKTARIYIV